jgi:hypothetical protein
MIPAAASTVAAVPVPGERWRVLGVFGAAVYLGGPHRAVLPLVAVDALLLPNAWRLPVAAADLEWGVVPGAAVPVGADGSLRVGAHRVRAVRAWRPRPVRRVPLDRSWTHSHAGFAAFAHAAAAAREAWAHERIGRGVGLTPEGDDEVCGALLVGHAVGDHTLAAAVRPLLARTTDLSAALLQCAGDGLAVPELTAFADALVRGDHGLADRLRPAVLAIGHSSGPALVRGVEQALAYLTEGELLRA